MEQQQQHQAKRQRSSPQQGAAQPPVPCARCGSGDTKFCYYNNYNTSQPRYFCRTCKRHWTHGGTLRNVPEGGSSNKTKKIKPSATATSSSSLKLPHRPQFLHNQAPVVAAGIGNLDRGPAPPPPFFYGGRAGGGVIGDELGFVNNSSGVLGDFGRANPALAPLLGLNPLDGINLQQLVQQPRLSLALHQNLLMFQQQQQQGNWRQNSPFTAAATSSNAASTGAADTAEEMNHRNNTIFNLPPPPPPPPSSFM